MLTDTGEFAPREYFRLGHTHRSDVSEKREENSVSTF